MKRYLYIFLSLFASIAFVACNNEADMPSGGETSPKNIKLLLKVKNEEASAMTRAGTEVGSDIENKITSLDIFFYNAQSKTFLYHQRITLNPGSTPEANPNWVVTDDVTGNKIITIPLNSWFDINSPMDVFVYANVPENKVSATSLLGRAGYVYTALTTASGKFDAEAVPGGVMEVSEAHLIPMEGYVLNKSFTLSDLMVNIPLRRILAKIRYKITFENNATARNFDLTKVMIGTLGLNIYGSYTPLTEFGGVLPTSDDTSSAISKYPVFISRSYNSQFYTYESGSPIKMVIEVPYNGNMQTFTIPFTEGISRNYIYDVDITIKGIGGTSDKLGLEINIIPWTVVSSQPGDEEAVGTYTYIPHYSKFYIDEGECYFDFIYEGTKTSKIVLSGDVSAFSMNKQINLPSDYGAYESTSYSQISFSAGTSVNKRIKIYPKTSTVGVDLPDKAITYKIYIGSDVVEEHKVEYQSINISKLLVFGDTDTPKCESGTSYGKVILTMAGVSGGTPRYIYNWIMEDGTVIATTTAENGTFEYDLLSNYDKMSKNCYCKVIDSRGKEITSASIVLPYFMN